MRNSRSVTSFSFIRWIAWYCLAFCATLGVAPLAFTPVPVAAAAEVAAAPPSLASTAKISLSIVSGPPGANIVITGSGFPPLEIVALYVDAPNPYLSVPGPRADAQGGFRVGVAYPNVNDASSGINRTKAGPHQICGDTGYPSSVEPIVAKACTQFTVLPGPSPTPSSVPNPAAPGLPIPAVLIALVVLIVVAGGAFLLVRRTGPKR